MRLRKMFMSKAITGITLAFSMLYSTCITTCASEITAPQQNKAASQMVGAGLADLRLLTNSELPVTRSDFTLVLLEIYEQAAKNKVLPSSETFSDIDKSTDAKKIEKAYKLGIIDSASPTTFSPGDPVTREQAAVIIVNFIDKMKLGFAPFKENAAFSDNDAIASAALTSVSRCVTSGIMGEYDESVFAPKTAVTNEKALELLYNLATRLELFNKVPASVNVNVNYDRADNFFIYGGKAYFTASTAPSEKKLYYADLSAKEPSAQLFMNNTVTAMHAEDGFLFIIEKLNPSKYQLSNVNLSTGAKTQLALLGQDTSLAYENGYIYCISGGKYIFKMKRDGSLSSTIYNSATRIWDLRVHNGFLYFNKDQTGLVRLKADGTDQKTVCTTNPNRFTVNGSKCYMLFKKEVKEKRQTPYDLYVADASAASPVKVKIMERVSRLFSTEKGVYAYRNEPIEATGLYSVSGDKADKLAGAGIDLLTMNNASNLHFSRDGKLYYTVMKPVSLAGALDMQTYQYTNVIDMASGKVTSITGGAAMIHCFGELSKVYGKMPYQVYSKTDDNDKAVIKKAEEVIAAVIKPNMTEAQKEKAIHDYIVKNCAYDVKFISDDYDTIKYMFYENSFNPTYIYKTVADSYTPYGALINRAAVCSGYTETFHNLLGMAGIESKIVTGTASNGKATVLHSWNIVKINGKYYNVDITWNDSIPDVAGKVAYTYFNLTDEQINKNHTAQNGESNPKCVTVWSD